MAKNKYGLRELKFHTHLTFLNSINFKLGCHVGFVDGNSMEPTLHDGDILTQSNNRMFRRGDIVIIAAAENGKFKTIVKRIVGLPGDKIIIRKQDNLLLLDGKIVTEPFIKNPILKISNLKDNTGKLTVVPEHSVFVLGDNRKGSLDSRQLGPIKVNTIIHKVTAVSTKDGKYIKLNRPGVYDNVAGDNRYVTAKLSQKAIVNIIKRNKKQIKSGGK